MPSSSAWSRRRRRDGDPCGWCVGPGPGAMPRGWPMSSRLWAPGTWLGAADSGTPRRSLLGGLDLQSGRGQEEAGGREASSHLVACVLHHGPSASHRGSGWEAPAAWLSPASLPVLLTTLSVSHLSLLFAMCLCLCALCFLSTLCLSLPLQLSQIFSPPCSAHHFPLMHFCFWSAAPSLPSLRFPLPAISC